MKRHRPTSLRIRLLAGLLLVATTVIVVFDVATVIAVRDWQTRRIDGLINQVAGSHTGHTGELIAGANRLRPPILPELAPNDYYIAIVTPDRDVVQVSAPIDAAPALPADLTELTGSDRIRTVPAARGDDSFRLRAVATEDGVFVAAVSMRPVDDAVHTLQVILAVATLAAMAVLAAGGLVVVRRGLRPLETMAAQADRITAGDLTRPVAPDTEDTEVGRLGLALNRMLARIHRSVEEQQAAQERTRQFFADASHELRTPLTSLRVNAELYEQGALTTSAEVDEAMRRIRVSAQRMGGLVDDMLRLARLDQQPTPRTERVDLTEVLTDALHDIRATDPGRTWIGDIPAGLAVHGHPDLLRRAVDNLLANIRTHTPEGTTGTLTACRSADQIDIEIGDDGPGVTDDALPRLFDRFYRTDHTGPGAGLGLAIVAQVAEGHGGRVTATNAPGLYVRLALPATPPPPIPRRTPMTTVTVHELTKRFGQVSAVEDLTFEVPQGQVTGFLGPNGAGKTTTLRMLLGLVRPTSGEALIDGRRYADLAHPRRTVGAVLESTGFHPGRRCRDTLRILADLTGVASSTVDDVLDQVGLTDAADRRVGDYSLGMRQRLGLAAAILGDPPVLLLDEPANGLDPEGMVWLRTMLRERADAGGTILISSHVLSEVAQLADHAVIIHRGRLRYAGPLSTLTETNPSLEAAFLDLTRA